MISLNPAELLAASRLAGLLTLPLIADSFEGPSLEVIEGDSEEGRASLRARQFIARRSGLGWTMDPVLLGGLTCLGNPEASIVFGLRRRDASRVLVAAFIRQEGFVLVRRVGDAFAIGLYKDRGGLIRSALGWLGVDGRAVEHNGPVGRDLVDTPLELDRLWPAIVEERFVRRDRQAEAPVVMANLLQMAEFVAQVEVERWTDGEPEMAFQYLLIGAGRALWLADPRADAAATLRPTSVVDLVDRLAGTVSP